MSILLVSSLAMTATLGILMLGGLLMIYFLLRSRLGRFEDSLREWGQKLERLSREQPQEPPTDAAPPPDLEPLTGSLDGMRRSLEGLEENLERVAGDLLREREVRLREMVERRFHGRGYQSIQILGDLSDGFHGTARVTIEGKKSGVTYKGTVTLEEGQIVEEKMTSSHEIFP